MRLQKTAKIMITVMAIMCMILPSAEAKKKDKGSKSKGDRTFMINVGGGFGLIIPGFDIYTEEWGSNYNQWTYVNFGGYVVGNFGMTFDMGKKKKWSLGPAVQLGWKAEGGPFAGYSEKRGRNIDVWTADQIYNGSDWWIANRGRFSHAFIADACVAIKGNPQKSARLVAEAGLRFSFAFMYDYVEWKNDTPNTIFREVDGWSSAKYRFMLGPSVFIGADAYAGDHVMLTPGLRIAAAFGPDWGIGVSTETKYDRFGNPIPIAEVTTNKYSYSHVYIDFAFELKINWYNKS